MNARLGWERIEDGGHLIGLFDEKGGAAISLEPGGQFELSGAPFETAHETADELARHLEIWRSVAEPLGLSALSLGMSPKWTLAETPTMPKSRYDIMRRYMPKVGTRGLDMMFRTATVQTNLDFRDEKDMVLKLRVALALQPAITALFANSPFTDGKLNGFLSARSEIWRDTDADRTGLLPFAFEPGMGFERYVDYALDVPLYFLKRGSTYIDVAGASFRDLLDGRLAAAPGERATIADWANHLSTIFPEVRLKRYLEMRGADVGPPDADRGDDGADERPLLRFRRALVGLGAGRGLDAPRSGRPCATRSRNSASPRRSAAGRCATSPATWSPSRAAGSRAGRSSTPRARTRRCGLRPSRRSPTADGHPRETGSSASKARGDVRSSRPSRKRCSESADQRAAPDQRACSSWLTSRKKMPRFKRVRGRVPDCADPRQKRRRAVRAGRWPSGSRAKASDPALM